MDESDFVKIFVCFFAVIIAVVCIAVSIHFESKFKAMEFCVVVAYEPQNCVGGPFQDRE